MTPSRALIPRPDPDYFEVDTWRRRVSTLRDQLAALQDERQAVQFDCERFLREYHRHISPLSLEIDRLDLDIKKMRMRFHLVDGAESLLTDEALEALVEAAYRKESAALDEAAAELESDASESQAEKTDESPQPAHNQANASLTPLYRDLTRAFHPDRAPNDSERQKFHDVFIQTVEAYAAGDGYVLQSLHDEFLGGATETAAEPASRLDRLREEAAALTESLETLRHDLSRLQQSQAYQLTQKASSYAQRGRSFLQELSADLARQARELRAMLQTIESDFKRARAGEGQLFGLS